MGLIIGWDDDDDDDVVSLYISRTTITKQILKHFNIRF